MWVALGFLARGLPHHSSGQDYARHFLPRPMKGAG